MKRVTDVLIVGGGVIGCSIAYYLSQTGVDCMVVDQGEIGAQASGAAVGLLAPLVSFDNEDFVPLLLASFRLFPSLVAELEAISDISIEYQRTGSLRTVNQPKRMRQLQRHMDTWRGWGFDVEWLTGDEARTVEPSLSERVCAAAVAPQEAQIKASSLVRAFVQAARNKGTTLLLQGQVTGISHQGATVSGVHLATDDNISCNQLVLATGAWSGMWEQWLDISLPVQPMKGQAIALQQPSPPIRHILMGEGVYIAPKSDESIVVGATKDNTGFDVSVTQEGVTWLQTAAQRLVPALKSSLLIHAWAGLRPKTPDSKPLLGRVGQWDNVVIATGHNAFGIQLSPITGLAIAELLTTGQAPQFIRAFSPSRFQRKAEGMIEL